MANATPDNTLQQQQAAQQAAQMRQAQKQNASHANPTVKFSQVMQTQQAAKSPTTIALLQKKNPVGGAEVVKAAISANGKKNSKVGTAPNVAANAATATTATGVTGSDSITSATGSDGTSGSGQLLQATARLQELNQDFNLQYLNLQENQQAESRQYTALSNVSKTKSDTAKNSLSNVK
jgi:hypothetical protein